LAPLTVVFTNTSTGDFDTSLWTFGDRITSTLEGPTHTYGVGGTYTVTLTISGLGGTDTMTRTNYITAYEPVTADFVAAPLEGLAPLTVVFTNTSAGDFDTSLWAFGDGMTSTLESPTYQYMLPGTYTVTLTISGAGGTDTEVKGRYITVRYGIYLPLLMRGS
jgi:PKD repeat protein